MIFAEQSFLSEIKGAWYNHAKAFQSQAFVKILIRNQMKNNLVQEKEYSSQSVLNNLCFNIIMRKLK